MDPDPIWAILQDAIPSEPLFSPEVGVAPPLTAEGLREAIRKLDEVFYPPPCGTTERPHLIHPRDWAEGNIWMCANLCGQMVDPKQMAGWDGPYEYPARPGTPGDDPSDQPR